MDAHIPTDGSGAAAAGVASGSNPPLVVASGLRPPIAAVSATASMQGLGSAVAKPTPHPTSSKMIAPLSLSGLADPLYNVYCTTYATSKQLWETLEKKYKLEDAGTKKFLVGKFLDYKIVDTKLVVNQMEELQIIISDLHSEGLVINEPFQVAAVIEKLPPSWKDFKNYLKHKRKELSMEDLALRLRIEEDNRKRDKVSDRFEAKAHLAEALKSQPKKQQGKRVSGSLGPKKSTTNKRIQGTCWVCGKTGHRAMDCRHKKSQSSGSNQRKSKPSYANMVEDDEIVAVITEVCMVDNAKG
ncbi:uncharacterized protein LOC127799207 [Diospyros lotus]|uniref:uncharacterized protein LOC127799207 n=1 Tax=Diospyros lotus TaxID=55363 RepID=UPI0022577A62|nr:uncharacterized protein LOC127799207 [Diospyros lotus]